MPDTEVLDTTTTPKVDKINGTLVEDKDIKGKGIIQYEDGTVLNFVRNAFDNTLPEVKKVLKTDKYKYVSPFDIAKAVGKSLDERSYVPGKLGDVLESEVLESLAAIMIVYGPTENLEYEDSREAVEILVDDEGNIHGDSDTFNELKNSGYYVLQKPEDVLTPEVIEEYKATVRVLTKTIIKDTKVDDTGFIVISYEDGTSIKFTKAGELVEDTRSEEPIKPYEDYADTLKDAILKEIEDSKKDEDKKEDGKDDSNGDSDNKGKETTKPAAIVIVSSTENRNTKTFTFNYSDGSTVIVKEGRIVEDHRTFGRRYQSIYTEMIYKYTELLDVGTDYFHEDPELTEAEQRQLAAAKIMNLPKGLLEKYTANRAMKNARVGHSKNSANSLGFKTSTEKIINALTNEKWKPGK